MRRFFLLLVALACFPSLAWGLDYRSVASGVAVLYDAPSLQAKRLYVVGKYFPLEVIFDLEGWSKIRDSKGELAWVEKKYLSDQHMVLVTSSLAEISQSADIKAPIVFQAEQSVVLEFIENASGGWAKVRHRDGQSGYVKISQIWGT